MINFINNQNKILKYIVKLLLIIFAILYFSFFQVTFADEYSSHTVLFNNRNTIAGYSGAYIPVDGTALQLTNAVGGFTAPFVTSGNARTLGIIPTSVAKWGTVTYTGTVPEGTDVKIRILDDDGILFPDSVLPGNAAGFSNPANISALSPLIVARSLSQGWNEAKIGRIQIQFLLFTTNTSVTPLVTGFTLTWTTKRGDLSATTISNSGWPSAFADQKGTRHFSISNPKKYSAVRWVSDTMEAYDTSNSLFMYNGELISSSWFSSPYPDYLWFINRDTGKINKQLPFSARGFFSIGQNGTGYQVDMTQDSFTTIDLNDASVKWTYDYYSGHGNDNIIIGSDGTLYTVRGWPGTTITLNAFNPDGSVKWTQNITVPVSVSGSSMMSQGSDGTLYIGTSSNTGNNGYLLAVDPETRALKWSYATGNINWLNPPAIDSNGTIYVAGSKIYAINPNGSLKWQSTYDNPNLYGYLHIVLRDDNTILATRTISYSYDEFNYETAIDALSTIDGSLLWSKSNKYLFLGFSDEDNNTYACENIKVDDNNNWISTGGYYDSSFNSIWKLVMPYNSRDGNYIINQNFKAGQNSAASFIPDERGWIYGVTGKLAMTAQYQRDYNSQEIKYFALSPWSLEVTTNSSSYMAGETISFSVTTAMGKTNPLTGNANKAQIILEDGEIIPLGYISTNSNGDSIWGADYVIASNAENRDYNFTVELSQANMVTDLLAHFESPPSYSENTGITITGTYSVGWPNVTELPETGKNTNNFQFLKK